MNYTISFETVSRLNISYLEVTVRLASLDDILCSEAGWPVPSDEIKSFSWISIMFSEKKKNWRSHCSHTSRRDEIRLKFRWVVQTV